MALLGETGLDLHERYVAGAVQQRQDQIGLRLNAVGMTVAALGGGLRASRVAVERAPTNRARRADAKAIGRLPTGHAAATTRSRKPSGRGLDMNAGLSPACSLNQTSADLGIPIGSERLENALSNGSWGTSASMATLSCLASRRRRRFQFAPQCNRPSRAGSTHRVACMSLRREAANGHTARLVKDRFRHVQSDRAPILHIGIFFARRRI